MPSAGVLIRGLVADRAVRALIVEAHGPADEARVRHGLSPVAARLTAQTMVAAALLSAHLKGEEELTLQIQSSKPRLAIYVDHTASGSQRARTTPSNLAPFQVDTDDRIDGVMLAIKSVGDKEVYRGITAIGGSIEQALSTHLGDSAQVDAILRIHVTVDEGGAVKAASGLLLERLPPEDDLPSMGAAAFTENYAFVATADAPALMTELAFGQLQGEAIEILDSQPLVWACRCSDEKVRSTLAAMGDQSLQEMILEDGGAEVICHFCNEVYRYDVAGLEAIRAALIEQLDS